MKRMFDDNYETYYLCAERGCGKEFTCFCPAHPGADAWQMERRIAPAPTTSKKGRR